MEKSMGRRTERGRGTRHPVLGPREKRRLIQLGICLVLFLVVFFAKGADRLAGLRGGLSGVLGTDADLDAVIAVLSGSVRPSGPAGQTVAELCKDVFLPQERSAPVTQQDSDLCRAARASLGSVDKARAFLLGQDADIQARPDPLAGLAAPAMSVTRAEPQPQEAAYTGPALPDNATMEQYDLGLAETVSPVVSRVTSKFGWRDDPLNQGSDRFHYGLDLAAAQGTDVLAFAAGTVDYIGESDDCGLYLQLDHGNGIKSFYAHCSKLLVRKGMTVKAGEKVAESGATGNVTGPHLHFELKKDNVRLNPTYYISFAS